MFERYAEDTYTGDQRYASTIGVDFKVKVSSVTTNRREHVCKLQMWDTAGQERFRAITQSYYRGTGICIVCFDTSTPGGERSIYSVRRWIEDVKWK
jgi:Ras-related protein Rab-1A